MPDVFKKRASFTGRHFSAAKNRLSKIAFKKRNGCLAPRHVQASLQFSISKLVYFLELYRAVYSLYLVSQFMVRDVSGGLQFTGLCSLGFRVSKGGLQFIQDGEVQRRGQYRQVYSLLPVTWFMVSNCIGRFIVYIPYAIKLLLFRFVWN